MSHFFSLSVWVSDFASVTVSILLGLSVIHITLCQASLAPSLRALCIFLCAYSAINKWCITWREWARRNWHSRHFVAICPLEKTLSLEMCMPALSCKWCQCLSPFLSLSLHLQMAQETKERVRHTTHYHRLKQIAILSPSSFFFTLVNWVVLYLDN